MSSTYDMEPSKEMMNRFVAVWGFGSTQAQLGELGRFSTREAAQACVQAYLDSETNQAVGAWVVEADK